jgi:hypothetical protein
MENLRANENSKITSKRIELKHLMRLRHLHRVEASLLASPLCFHESFPPRKINSLYFDTPDFKTVNESFSGSSNRAKHRFRWYGEVLKATTPTYEIKCKKGHLSWKSLTPLDFSIDTNAYDWDSALMDNSGVSASRIISLPGSRPVSIVSYYRRYYESAHSRVRVTLDNEISYLDQTTYFRPNFSLSRDSPEKLVVEIKVSQKDSALLEELKKTLDFVPQRFSKYCESLLGHLPRWR